MLVPDEPEIGKIVDLNAGGEGKQRRDEFNVYHDQLASIETLFSSLTLPPPSKARQQLSAKIKLEVTSILSEDDGFTWRRRFLTLVGEELTVYFNPDQAVFIPSDLSFLLGSDANS